MAKSLPSPAVMAWTAAAMLVSLGIAATIGHVRRRFLRDLLGELRNRGFSVTDSSVPFDSATMDFMAWNPLLGYDRCELRWLAIGVHHQRHVQVMEVQWAVQHGTNTYFERAVLVLTDLVIDAAPVVLERKNWFKLTSPREKPKALALDDQAFAKRFDAYYARPSGVRAILIPPARAILKGFSRSEFLQFRNGALVLGDRQPPNVRRIDRLLDGVVHVARAVETAQKQTSPPKSGLA